MNGRPDLGILREEEREGGLDRFYESIFFQGNGRFGFRGFRDEGSASDPGERCTYAAGFFGELKPGITEMVNCPDFLSARIEIDGRSFGPGGSRSLDMGSGILSTERGLALDDGARFSLRSHRFPSLADRRLALQRFEFTAHDRDVRVSVGLGIDGRTVNRPIHDDQLKKNDEVVSLRRTVRALAEADGLLTFGARAAGTGIAIELAQSSRVLDGTGKAFPVSVSRSAGADAVSLRYSFVVPRGSSVVVERVVVLATSRDPFGISVIGREGDPAADGSFACSDAEAALLSAAVSAAARNALAEGEPALRSAHAAAWSRIWEDADLEILGDEGLTAGLRFSVFQLVQSCAADDEGVSIGARGLTHGRYKGCFFWDTDVFMLPFFALVLPDAARRLLAYRVRTLPGARANARGQGVKGARYAWMCTLDGREQCDTWDIGMSEIHITADVAWSVLRCREWMGADAIAEGDFLELLVETARYWASRFTLDQASGRWNLLWVKGPDEYGGVTHNSVFTVAMARENLRAAAAVADAAAAAAGAAAGFPGWRELADRLGFDPGERGLWERIAGACVLPYDAERSLYLEDEFFLRKEPISLADAKRGDEALYRSIPFDRLQRLRVLKQADLVLLGLLLPDFFSAAEARAVWDFYEPITAHDSTLSFGSHAEAAARLGLTEDAERYLRKAARLDLDDLMVNVAEEGLHLAAAGGSWRALAFGFAGLSFPPIPGPDGFLPLLDPILPAGWEGYRFSFAHGGARFRAEVGRDGWTVSRAYGEVVSRGRLRESGAAK